MQRIIAEMSRRVGCYTAGVNRYWVGIDQGSTATKACLLDARGRVRQVVSRRVATQTPAAGWVEQDPEELLGSVRRGLNEILRGVSPWAIGGVGIACQRSTCLFWDAESGRPLTLALSWQDRRGEAFCEGLARHASAVARRTGLRLSPHYAASKIRWLLDRTPGLRRLARSGRARFGTLDSYFLFRLTGGVSWSTDPTHAARTLLMDLRRLDWDPELLDLFGVPYRALPPIRPSAFPAGEIRIRGARIRIAATLGDQQAALLGVGCSRRGEMVINYGTGAFAALNTGRHPVRIPGLLTSVAWSTERVVRFLLEGPVNAAGSAVEWMEGLVGPPGRDEGSLGDLDTLPVVIPALAGVGAPHWRSDLNAAILDLRRDTGPVQLRAATLAGIACRVREIVDRMGRHRKRADPIMVAGGLLRRGALLQFQASLLSAALCHALSPDATVRGAALLAGHAQGAWDLVGRDSPAAPARRVSPGKRNRSAGAYYRRFVSHLQRLLDTSVPARLEL
jgi:glycerol kinase